MYEDNIGTFQMQSFTILVIPFCVDIFFFWELSVSNCPPPPGAEREVVLLYSGVSASTQYTM